MSQQSHGSPADGPHANHWPPTANLDVLQARSHMLRRLREFFHVRGFYEVQTPVLGNATVVDRHIDPIEVSPASIRCGPTGERVGDAFYLQTSPEFCMKRLLAAGMQAIYQIGPVFRAAERGQLHNPEFTMVEWYRVGDDFAAGIELLSELVQSALECSTVDRTTYQRAFELHTGCDPLAATGASLAELGGSRLNVSSSWSDDKDDWLNLIFAELVQPELGRDRPEIVTHYPASQSALARLSEPPAARASKSEPPQTAERFELFVHGVELANGYHELTDASELAARNTLVNSQRAADGKKLLPASNQLLLAMQAGLPACAGCALGLDRLLMVHLGLASIDQVLAFPIERS